MSGTTTLPQPATAPITHAQRDYDYEKSAGVSTASRWKKAPMAGRGPFMEDLFAASVEFVGTVLYLLFTIGAYQTATDFGTSGLFWTFDQIMYASVTSGFALLFVGWLLYRGTSAFFNPNVALALLLTGAIRPLRFVLYFIAHLAGGIAAAALIQALFPGGISANTVLLRETSKAQGVFIEFFATGAFVFAVLILSTDKYRVSGFTPIGVGIAYFVCSLWALPYTSGSLNTARSFGAAVVHQFFSTQWIYWVGPFAGSLLATAFYWLFRSYGPERIHTLSQDDYYGAPVHGYGYGAGYNGAHGNGYNSGYGNSTKHPEQSNYAATSNAAYTGARHDNAAPAAPTATAAPVV